MEFGITVTRLLKSLEWTILESWAYIAGLSAMQRRARVFLSAHLYLRTGFERWSSNGVWGRLDAWSD